MTGTYRNVTGTEQGYTAWDIVTTCIRHTSSYDMIRLSIYMIYTRYILNGKGIYLVYIWYISGIYMAYLIYRGIYQVYALIIRNLYLEVGAEVVGTAPYRQCI
jgi:hypothetical protein